MSNPTLVIGNKAYSSWSLRPWLLMKHAGIAFDEVRIPLYRQDSKETILRYSPAGRVPVLVDGGLTVWDSLAICEYLAEKHPEKRLWPADTRARANARSVSAEMHSGFVNLRGQMAMNVRRRMPGRGRTPEVLAEISRIQTMWNDCRARFGAEHHALPAPHRVPDALRGIELHPHADAVGVDCPSGLYADRTGRGRRAPELRPRLLQASGRGIGGRP